MTERVSKLLLGVYQTLAAADEHGSDEFTSQHVKLAKANIEEALGVLKTPLPAPEPVPVVAPLGAAAPLKPLPASSPAKPTRKRTTSKKKR